MSGGAREASRLGVASRRGEWEEEEEEGGGRLQRRRGGGRGRGLPRKRQARRGARTWSGSSWILTSWNFSNLEPRVCRCKAPPLQHELMVHFVCGMKVAPFTIWYTSLPPCSHVYVATRISGLTSVTRVTMPFIVSRVPMCLDLTSRSGTILSLVRGSTRTVKRRVSSGGTRSFGSEPPGWASFASAAARTRSSIRMS